MSFVLVKYMRQQLHLDSRVGWNLGTGTLFWLQDPIVMPIPRYAFTLSDPIGAVPLTHYVISATNRTLDISYPGQLEPLIIDFPLGDHGIYEFVDVLNRRLLFGFKAASSEYTNTLHFTSQNLGAALSIGPATTSGGLLGVRVGDESVLGS
jgi:hypothetical protein